MAEDGLLGSQPLSSVRHEQTLEEGQKLGRDVGVLLEHVDRVELANPALKVLCQPRDVRLLGFIYFVIVLDQTRINQFEDQNSDRIVVVSIGYTLSRVIDPVLLACGDFGVEDEHFWRHCMQRASRHGCCPVADLLAQPEVD